MKKYLRILFIADIIGKPGRNIIKKNIVNIKNLLSLDMIIANIENLAGGFGITAKTLNEINNLGAIDIYTSGNHIWDKKEAENVILNYPNLLRPLNYPEQVPGKGFITINRYDTSITVINLLGRALMKDCVDCPFKSIDNFLSNNSSKITIVDFHAESTSEKEAMFFYLNGRVSALLGTHTHVQTADEKVSNEGTAYITDAGRTGNVDSVIGFGEKNVIERYLTQMPKRFEIKNQGRKEIQGVILTIDINSGKSLTIDRFRYKE